ncbi:hypothetical protein MAR_035020 [Mya arenaria]|uniref:LRAT domain-containing protein n=1 Tax=Mya arenaria TaxID=6604 RepID=A0ABY7ELE6_MYAAR|nr:hypothetical protein MAR_035020 [Mya arenaria]
MLRCQQYSVGQIAEIPGCIVWSASDVSNHIVFYGYTYDHHGIVAEINRKPNSIKVIEATNTFLGSMFGIIRFQKARIIETVKRPNFKSSIIQLVVYKHRKYTNNEIVQRAREFAIDYKYNVFNNNCEHFATECVTGHAFSAQIGKYEIALKLFWQGGLSAIFDERKRNMSMNRIKHICDTCYKKNTLLLGVPPTPITNKNDVKKGDIIRYRYYFVNHEAVILEASYKEKRQIIKCHIAHYAFRLFSCNPMTIQEEVISIKLN